MKILTISVLIIVCVVAVPYFFLSAYLHEEPRVRDPNAIIDGLRWVNTFAPRLDPDHPRADDVRYPLYGVNVWETSAEHADYTTANILLQTAPWIDAGKGALYAIEKKTIGEKVTVVLVLYWEEFPFSAELSPNYSLAEKESWLPMLWLNFMSNVSAFNWTIVHDAPDDSSLEAFFKLVDSQ